MCVICSEGVRTCLLTPCSKCLTETLTGPQPFWDAERSSAILKRWKVLSHPETLTGPQPSWDPDRSSAFLRRWQVLSLPETLTGPQPSWDADRSSASQEISHFYGTQRFITACTSARQLSLSWARLSQSMLPPFRFSKTRLNMILPSTPVFQVLFCHQNRVCTSTLLHTFYMPCTSHSSQFDLPNHVWWGVQIIKLLVM